MVREKIISRTKTKKNSRVNFQKHEPLSRLFWLVKSFWPKSFEKNKVSLIIFLVVEIRVGMEFYTGFPVSLFHRYLWKQFAGSASLNRILYFCSHYETIFGQRYEPKAYKRSENHPHYRRTTFGQKSLCRADGTCAVRSSYLLGYGEDLG
ncbi:DUF1661 domain-containing protein [Porphyromonas gingivalis]